ncbi:MAG TPA: hypothetical protein VMP01_25525 [Pirellulaceae bacterium]|nr:hypothetical protein [Pirellulaceae bacterium]
MPIKVTCACGQSFAAKDELAGRTVKCPKCSRPLAIPAAGGAGAVPASPLAPQPTAAAAAPAAGYQPSGLFDEVGIQSTPVGTQPCPGCRAPMPMHAVVCVQCGYNLKLGRRMETMRVGADGQMGHGSLAEAALARAAQALEEEKEEERKKTREGLPWWAYLVMLLGVLGFLVLMMMIPQQNAVGLAGGAVVFGGVCLSLYGYVRILVVAFREHPGHGLGCLFCAPYFLYFLIIKWDECGGAFFIWLGGQVLQMVGYGVVIAGSQFSGEETVWLPAMRDVMLAMIDRFSLAYFPSTTK